MTFNFSISNLYLFEVHTINLVIRIQRRIKVADKYESQLAHYVFTTLQFGCCLVRSLSCVKITLPQRILDTWYASRCDNVFSNVFVTYGYGLDANVKAQRNLYVLVTYSEYAIYVICKTLWHRTFQRFCYVRIWFWC